MGFLCEAPQQAKSTFPVPQHASPRPSSTIRAAAPYFSRTTSRKSSRSIRFRSPMFCPLSAAVQGVGRAPVVEEADERGDGLAVDVTDHVLASPLHIDQSGKPQLLDVVRDGRVDLVRSRYVAADLSHGRTVDWAHVSARADRDRAAATSQEVEDTQPSGIAQRFEHLRDLLFVHVFRSSYISRTIELLCAAGLVLSRAPFPPRRRLHS